MSAEQEIYKELEPGERILWSGIPEKGITFSCRDIVLIPIGLLWIGCVIFLETVVIPLIPHGASWIFHVGTIAFFLFGLFLVAGRFFVDAWYQKKVFYGLTNKRVIMVCGLFSRSVHSTLLSNIIHLLLTERPNGVGSILIVQSNPRPGFFGNLSLPGMNRGVPDVHRIANAKVVCNTIKDAIKMRQWDGAEQLADEP